MKLTLDQALQKGVEAHKAGKVQEADQYYTAILKAQPKHPDANHNMGVLAVGVGKVEEALSFFKTALEANSSVSQFWLSYINALIKLNRLDEAKAVFDEAKGKGAKGDEFEQLEKQLGSSTSKKSNAQEPSQEELQSLINLYTQGHYQETLTQASQLLKEFPHSINLYNILGAANKQLGKLDKAIEAYKKALSIEPYHGNAKHMLSALTGNKNETAPREYVENLFDGYSRKFEASLVNKLEYKTPKFIRDILKKLNSSRSLGSVLDLGCGTGLLGPEIRDHCSRLEGIDLSSKMLELAKQKNVYDKLSHLDIVEYLSSKSLDFDYYIALDVFIYVGELTEIFRLIKSRAKHPGHLVFSTEHTELDGYHILKTGRYSHSKTYIESLCKKFDYNVAHFSTTALRKEKDSFLTGGMYVLSF